MDFNETTTTTDRWPGETVEDLEPYEEWDLIAWPKHGFTGDEFEQVFDRMKTPHINGQPMRVGYVVSVNEDAVEVLEAEPSRFGPERVKNPGIQMPTIVYKRDVVAKKQREHNPKYQDHQQELREREARGRALTDWRELPAWKRWTLFLTASKGDWIDARASKIRERDE